MLFSARNLLFGREDCPPQWLSLIEDMFAEGDLLIEDATKARDELQLEVREGLMYKNNNTFCTANQ